MIKWTFYTVIWFSVKSHVIITYTTVSSVICNVISRTSQALNRIIIFLKIFYKIRWIVFKILNYIIFVHIGTSTGIRFYTITIVTIKTWYAITLCKIIYIWFFIQRTCITFSIRINNSIICTFLTHIFCFIPIKS